MSPAGLTERVPWDGEAVIVVGVCPWALVPVNSCAEEVTRHSPMVEKDLGGSSEDGVGVLECWHIPPTTSSCF